MLKITQYLSDPFHSFFRIVCKLWMLLGFQLTTEQEVKKNKTWNLFIFFPKKSKTYKGSIYMLKDAKHRFYISVLFT